MNPIHNYIYGERILYSFLLNPLSPIAGPGGIYFGDCVEG
jgi:hypothetical protein